MDYPALDLGHKTGSRTTLSLVDLDVHIWGLEEIKGSQLPIGVVVSSTRLLVAVRIRQG